MRVRLGPWGKGLWLSGGPDQQPQGTLRRMVNLANWPLPTLRRRKGSSEIVAAFGPIHSMIYFEDTLYTGVGTDIYTDGVTLADTGYNGSRLIFLKAPKTEGQGDQLYIAGGGQLRRVDPTAGFGAWGIPAPTDIMWAQLGNQHNDILTDDLVMGNLTDTTGVALSGGYATMSPTPSTPATCQIVALGGPLNLEWFSVANTKSLEGDYITLSVKVADPKRIGGFTVAVDCGDGSFDQGSVIYSRTITFTNISAREFQVSYVTDGHPNDAAANQSLVSTTGFPADTWVLLQLPKTSFAKTNVSGIAGDWGTVQAFKLTATVPTTETAGTSIALWGGIRLRGGHPNYGTYRYRVVWRNKISGARSNPNPADTGEGVTGILQADIADANVVILVSNLLDFPASGVVRIDEELIHYTAKTVTELTGCTRGLGETMPVEHLTGATVTVIPNWSIRPNRQPVFLANLPQPPSSDYEIEIYRTIADNETFYYLDTVQPPTALYTDEIGDPGAIETLDKLLSSTPLLFDNNAPDATFRDATGLFAGRVWWAGEANTVHYSASGRYEAAQGFITVGSSEDQVERLIIWNGALYVFTKMGIFQVVGQDEPFAAPLAMSGAPGVTARYTVVPTPYGIAYLSQDGPRLFTGQAAELLAWDAIAPLFRGLSVDGLTAFAVDTATATYARNEYILCDGTTTLAVNLTSGAWRVLTTAVPFGLLTYYTPEDQLLATHEWIFGSERVIALEDPTVNGDDAGIDLPFSVETGHLSPAPDASVLVQRIYIDADLGGQVLTPVLLLDGTEVTLPSCMGTGRKTYEISLTKSCKRFGLRFTGTLDGAIEIYRVEADIYGVAQEGA